MIDAAAPTLPAPPAGDEELDRRRLAVVSSQASSLRWQIVATTLVVTVLVWPFVPAAAALAWLVTTNAVREWRAWRLRRMVDDETEPMAERLERVVALNLLIGSVNGAAAFFMFWLDDSFDALLTMVLVSWAAGAVSTSAPLLRAYLAYASCLFVPTAAMWLAAGPTPTNLGVAALILMFAGVQHRFAKQNAAVFEESYRIRMEKEDLLRQLAQARDAAESANQAKSRFLAVASHDLRQPLHALTLHSGLLAQDPYTADAPRIAGEISASIDSLARLLDSLLDISKLDAGVVTVSRRPIRLPRLLAQLVRHHRPRAAEKEIGLHLDCPPQAVVESDPLLLERLLGNLVDNAVKYTDRGEVRVTARADGGDWRVVVGDTGRGIPDAARARVFDEFYRVDPDAREHGLGLGLAIVRRLALLLEMPITMDSVHGRGTSFELRLPRAASPAGEEHPVAPAGSGLRRLKVLFIDDEESVRRAMANVLGHFGCEAVGAAGIDEALARAAEVPPDLVLADWRLRDGDTGLAAIRRLRERQPGLPALLISGDTDTQLLREAERHGLRVLAKPVTLSRLREAIVRVLQEREAAITEEQG